LGTELPVLPVQLLWVNLATAILLGTSLIFEPKEPGLMDLPPRPAAAPILDRGLLIRTVLVSVLLGLAAFGFFAWARRLGLSAEQGRTLAINTIVVVEVGYLFACRSLRLPAWHLGLWSNRWMWLGVGAMLLAQLAFTYLPVMNGLFHTAPVDASWWLALSVTGLVVYGLAEVKKLLTKNTLAAARTVVASLAVVFVGLLAASPGFADQAVDLAAAVTLHAALS
jgi:magnesium-transporting ATPase (P-type)